jgi:hypothetical protein
MIAGLIRMLNGQNPARRPKVAHSYDIDGCSESNLSHEPNDHIKRHRLYNILEVLMSRGCYSIIIIILLQFSPTQTTASDLNQAEVLNGETAPFITQVKNKGKEKTKTNNHLQFRCALKSLNHLKYH